LNFVHDNNAICDIESVSGAPYSSQLEVIQQLKEELAASKREFKDYKKESEKNLQSIQENNLLIQNKLLEAKDEIKSEQEKNFNLSKKLTVAEELIKSLERELYSVKNKVKNKKEQFRRKEIIKFIFDKLGGVLTSNQIEILLGLKKWAHWSTEELQTAYTLSYMGKKAYNFVTKKMKIPFPSLSKLHRWASKLDIQPGNLRCVMEVMKVVAPCYQACERVSVITFDEMKVQEILEYDQKHDRVLGPHSQMQVAMIRGLFSKWKMPIYMDFDRKMTKELLSSLIKEVNDAGYLVKACTSDMGGGKQGLLKELGISKNHSYIQHPALPEEKIYFFADAPHCLKLIRNWLLDTGFKLEDGSVVTKEPLERLLTATASPDNPLELSSCFKLTEAHLKCEKTERQNVRLAAELMSHTNATALKRYFPQDNPALQLSSVLEIVNAWFVIFNSYVLYDIPTKSAFGTNSEIQEEYLDKMSNLMSTMLCSGKTCLQVFQKAIIMSIASLKLLKYEMELKYQKPYLLTYRLNQDLLENFFSQLRTRGGLHDYPTPLECFYRMRMIILGKNPGIVQANSNALDRSKDTGDEFVTATAMRIIEEDLSSEELRNHPDEPEECADIEMETPLEQERTVNRSVTEQMDFDGLEYLAGWVAYKHKKETWLGCATRDGPRKSYLHLPSWVQHLSFGGLMDPSPEWMQKCKEIEAIFQKFHGSEINKGPKTVQKCTFHALCKISSVSETIIKTYVLQRTRIRIKNLNAYDHIKKQNEKAAKEEEKKKKQEEKKMEGCRKEKETRRESCTNGTKEERERNNKIKQSTRKHEKETREEKATRARKRSEESNEKKGIRGYHKKICKENEEIDNLILIDMTPLKNLILNI